MFDGQAGERILEVAVAGRSAKLAAPRVGRGVENDTLRIRGQGHFYWISFSATGDEQITIFPAPEAGLSIEALAVVEPADMVQPTDEPQVPRRFRPAIVDYVAAIAQGAEEDNFELRQFHQEAFDAVVADLVALRTSRQGRTNIQMQVQGFHF